MAKIKVKAPQKDFTGTVCGVDFVKGEATVDTAEQLSAVHYFRRHGFEVASYGLKSRPAEKQG
jgi:hypothetical protein